MKIENFGGIEVNVDETLQDLLGVGEIKIEKEDGYYVLKQFSFEQFIEDLHDQSLEDVENWLMGLIAKGMVKC